MANSSETRPPATPTAVEHGQRLLQFLSEPRGRLAPLLIVTHDFPDPDALEEVWKEREKELQTRLLRRLRVSAKTEARKPFAD